MVSAAIPFGDRSSGRVVLANDVQRRDARRIAPLATSGTDEPAALLEGRVFSKQCAEGEPTPEPAQTSPPPLPDLLLVRSHRTVLLNQTGPPCPPRCLASEPVVEPDMLLNSKDQTGYLGCASDAFMSCGPRACGWLVEAACGVTSPDFCGLRDPTPLECRSSSVAPITSLGPCSADGTRLPAPGREKRAKRKMSLWIDFGMMDPLFRFFRFYRGVRCHNVRGLPPVVSVVCVIRPRSWRSVNTASSLFLDRLRPNRLTISVCVFGPVASASNIC